MDSEALVKAAHDAVPTLAEHAAQTERDRRVADESVAAARAAGAFALAMPHLDGGAETNVTTRVRVLAALGRGCPSTAWIAATTAETKIPLRTMASDHARADAFADPDAVLCSSARQGRAVAVPGKLRVTGRWMNASGCEHATWTILAAGVYDGDRLVRPGVVFVPTAGLTVDRDWNMAGLAGTGSHTLVAEDLFVPDSHVLDTSRAPGGIANLATALSLFAPLLGAARGAVDVMAAVLDDRIPPSTGYRSLTESPGARQWFAEATHLVDSAERRVLGIAKVVDDVGDDPLEPQERSGLRMDLLSATRECRRALDDLLDLHGSSGFATVKPLQRFWRDFAVGSRHVSLPSYLVAEDYGRLLTGDGEPAFSLL